MKALRKAHVIAIGAAFILLSIIALASYLTSPAPVSGQGGLGVTLAITSIDQCTGEVCFTATASGGTPPYTYDWDWDDDGTYDLLDGGASPCHIYDPGGPYTARVRVTDKVGSQATATANVGTINEPVDVALSVVSINHCTREVCFAATASGGTGVYIYDWDWDGDGTYDLLNGGASPCHTYDLGGPYTARVRVTDGNSCQAMDEGRRSRLCRPAGGSISPSPPTGMAIGRSTPWTPPLVEVRRT